MQLLALVNEQLWLGHFDLWQAEGVIMYRNALLLTEGHGGRHRAARGDARRRRRSLRALLSGVPVRHLGRQERRRRRLPRCFSRRTAKPDLAMIAGAQPLLLVGAGKMGGAMLERWLASGLDAAAVTILDPYLEGERWAELAKAGVATATERRRSRRPRIQGHGAGGEAAVDGGGAAAGAGARERAARRSSRSPPACGSRRSRRHSRRDQAIVRAMPNTPAQVGMSMTVAVPNANVNECRARCRRGASVSHRQASRGSTTKR